MRHRHTGAFLVRSGAKVIHLCAKDETEKAHKMREISLMIIHMFPENLAALKEQENLKKRIADDRVKGACPYRVVCP